VPGIIATATALAETDAERPAETARVAGLRDRLVRSVAALDAVHETVPPAAKIAGSAHLLIEGVESESLLFLLDEAGVCASAASACASGAMEQSHVLAAMGLDPALTAGAVRLTLGHTSTETDIDRATVALVDAITTLRARARSKAAAP
jgi:cysteine desulfurase